VTLGEAREVRVVSLVPSVTETLLQWGVVPAACTRFCEQPDLVHVGGTKDPDIAAIVRLAPDLVVMCDEENRREDAEALGAAGLRVHSCSPRAVADVADALHELGRAVDIDVTQGSTAVLTGVPLGLRAFVPIWRRPWMSLAGDTYGSSVLAALGVTNVFADQEARYPEVDLDAAKRLEPDIVLAPSEPYPFGQRHVEELSAVARVLLVDGRDLFWWGVRTPAAVDRLRSHIAAVR
jgi:ABC-type Fe3+-hydroxamate transport system substrate-binding protein